MKLFVAVLAVAVSALFLPGLASAPAQAQGATAARPATPSDVSAARRKHHRTATEHATPPRAMWNGANPNNGPGSAELRQLQREGRCVIDEGYGRWTSCSNE
jgi:hypothetical protein